MSADITAIILTKNEEINIRDCIASICNTVKRIIVIDSFSSDQTVEIAKKYGAEIIQHEFVTHAKQYKYAVESSNITTKWILRIDADERLTPDSAQELERLCNENTDSDVTGIVVRFKKNFLGKDLYHGGVYPWKKLICYKTGMGDIEDRAMDEHIVVFSGRVIELKNDSLHFDFKSLEVWTSKHNWYSSKEAADYNSSINTGKEDNYRNLKTWIKMKIYYKLPIGMRAHLYYLYRYYIKLGFLDGREGKIYAFLQAYWYRYLVDAKIYESKLLGTQYNEKGTVNKDGNR